MSAPKIYLDHNATSPLRPEAAAAMAEAMAVTGNPSSGHGFGRRARALIEGAREKLASLLNCRAEHVHFTATATEANNWALSGARTVLCSDLEHPSVLAVVPGPERAAVSPDGVVDAADFAARMRRYGPDRGALMFANNETGVIQPVHEVANAALAEGCEILVDAVQVFGKAPLNLDELPANLISLSAHKLGGPAGVGALIIKNPDLLRPIVQGGGQERRRRAGTENLIGIAGFAAAAAAACRDLNRFAALAVWRDRIDAAVVDRAGPDCVPGRAAARLANTTVIRLPGLSSQTQVMNFDLAGIAVSAGSACSSGTVAASPGLLAMGLSPSAAGEVIRVSLGWSTTEEEVARFIACWTRLHDRHAASAA